VDEVFEEIKVDDINKEERRIIEWRSTVIWWQWLDQWL